jgi:asparagine synthase (glutamine-hydrolysing)
MCGIAGVLHLDSARADGRLAARMIARLGHRGPDDRGVAVDGPVGLAHARLSIIDLAGGRQPMANEDSTLWITFNGEIFNYIELREELVARGRRFATRSDTEVILHAYEAYGRACVERFNGQWAFAIWDRRAGRLFASRDRLGVRPFHYAVAGGKFLFGSEVKAIFADPDVRRALDPRGLGQVFTFWSPLPPTTVFEGVRELPPGHNLVVERGAIRTERYWQLRYDVAAEPESLEVCAEQLLDLLTDATRLRLRADVPVGAYLSGGLDSTVATALIQRVTSAPLKTFSITFDDPEFDESLYQQAAIDHLGTEHQAVRCSQADIARVFPDVIRHTERPVLRTAPAPLYLLSRLVRDEGFKVVMTGEGADEMLGGYDIFKEAKVRRFCAAAPDSAFRAAAFRRLYPYLPKIQAQSVAYRKAFFHVDPAELDNPFFSHRPRWELTARLKMFLAPELRAAMAGCNALGDCESLLPEGFSRWDPFCRAQWLEATMLLPGYILSSQGDRMAMAHGVEGRFPFLDHRLAELAAGIPPRWKMRGMKEKYILKRAAAGLVPEAVLRRSKQPYRAPDAASFFDPATGRARAAYVEELLSPERLTADGVFDPRPVGALIEKVRRGRAIGVRDNMAVVAILSTQLLVERFIREPAGPGLPEVDLPPAVPLADAWQQSRN